MLLWKSGFPNKIQNVAILPNFESHRTFTHLSNCSSPLYKHVIPNFNDMDHRVRSLASNTENFLTLA